MSEIARLGVVGAGWWATHNHIPIIRDHPHAECTAVCRLGPEELEAVKEGFGFLYATEDYDRMLSECELDGMIVTSPHHLHFEHAKRALEAGLHVLVEKPMTTTAENARALVATAEKHGKEIMIPHGWNFRDYVARAREWVESGRIGEVQHVSIQMASPAETLFSGDPYPGTEDHMFRPPASTWADPNNFGGYGWGQFPHLLGCLFRIADLVPERVTAVSRSSRSGVDLYDAAIIQFAGGVNASMSGAGTVPMNSRFQLDIRIFGTEGMLLLDVERERLWLRRNDDQNETLEIAEGDGDYVCDEPVKRFIDICRGKDVINEAPGLVGMRAIEVVDAMYRSIESGSTVSV